MDDTWLSNFFDGITEGHVADATTGTLRQRGGGAAVHRGGAKLFLATSTSLAEDEISQAAQPSAEVCFERMTSVTPPPRLKRSRKSEARDVSSVSGKPMDALDDGETLALTNSFTTAFDFGTAVSLPHHQHPPLKYHLNCKSHENQT